MWTKTKIDTSHWYDDHGDCEDLLRSYGLKNREDDNEDNDCYQRWLDLFESERVTLDNEQYLDGANLFLEEYEVPLKAMEVDVNSDPDCFLWRFEEV